MWNEIDFRKKTATSTHVRQNLLLNQSIVKNRNWLAFAVTFCAFWHLVFGWPILDYPSYAKGPCYSPKHSFYVTRHQSLWEASNISTPHDFGTARLYDRSGNLLYEEKTLINEEFGPLWREKFKNNPTDQSTVFYQGTEAPGWIFRLPDSPGAGNPNKSCYPEQTD